MTSEVRKLKAETPALFLPHPDAKDEVYWMASASGKYIVQSAMKLLQNPGARVI